MCLKFPHSPGQESPVERAVVALAVVLDVGTVFSVGFVGTDVTVLFLMLSTIVGFSCPGVLSQFCSRTQEPNLFLK